MKLSSRVVFGVIVIAIGILLFLGSLEIIDAGDYISDYWPIIIILFGVFSIIERDSSTFFGIVLILVGAYLQMAKLDIEILDNISISSLIFPGIVVLIGLKLLLPEKK